MCACSFTCLAIQREIIAAEKRESIEKRDHENMKYRGTKMYGVHSFVFNFRVNVPIGQFLHTRSDELVNSDAM